MRRLIHAVSYIDDNGGTIDRGYMITRDDRIEAIATLAQVCAAEGDMLRAAELLAFVVAHPATAHRVRQPTARLLAELEAELPAEQFAAAAARGRARELDEVVAELIGEPARL